MKLKSANFEYERVLLTHGWKKRPVKGLWEGCIMDSAIRKLRVDPYGVLVVYYRRKNVKRT